MTGKYWRREVKVKGKENGMLIANFHMVEEGRRGNMNGLIRSAGISGMCSDSWQKHKRGMQHAEQIHMHSLVTLHG